MHLSITTFPLESRWKNLKKMSIILHIGSEIKTPILKGLTFFFSFKYANFSSRSRLGFVCVYRQRIWLKRFIKIILLFFFFFWKRTPRAKLVCPGWEMETPISVLGEHWPCVLRSILGGSALHMCLELQLELQLMKFPSSKGQASASRDLAILA